MTSTVYHGIIVPLWPSNVKGSFKKATKSRRATWQIRAAHCQTQGQRWLYIRWYEPRNRIQRVTVVTEVRHGLNLQICAR